MYASLPCRFTQSTPTGGCGGSHLPVILSSRPICTKGREMRHRSAGQFIGIYTDDPVACRALGVLLRFAGYTSECLCAGKELGWAMEGMELLVVGPGMGAVPGDLLVGQVGIPLLHLVGHGEEAGTEAGMRLSWPVSSAELIRAIDTARGVAPHDT